MKTILLLKKLQNYPLFTQNDVVKITAKRASYTKVLLSRLVKKGYIKRVERGKYTVIEDALVFASHIYTPSYLSSWTGLRFYDMTTQLPIQTLVFLPIYKKPIKTEDWTIVFIKTRHMWGYEKLRRGDFDIFMADREKIIIDCLLTRINSAEIFEALKSEEIDSRKLIQYAEKTKSTALIKRLGFLLERLGKDAQPLLKYVDNNYVLLDRQKTGFRKSLKWRVKYSELYDKFGIS